MTITFLKKIILISAIFLLIAVLYFYNSFKSTQVIHLAFVGGLSGENASNGKSLVEGIQLYIDMINQQGGIKGRQIVLDIFDDQNNPVKARQKALEIAQQNSAMAVIGHWYSSCSLSGGEIYKKHHIPAVSPTSTNIEVTQDNEWYFRTIFDDNLQGRFLANYVKKVFRKNVVSIIHSDRPYGAYLAQVFKETAQNLQTEVKYQWNFQTNNAHLDQNLTKIVYELKLKEKEAGIIFLATHANEGVKLVKLIKDFGIQNVVITPDAFASKTFQQGFNSYPKERSNPGYYTRGIYVTTPIIFDSASEKAHQFKKEYFTKYQAEPGWRAAFAYDAALVIIEALKKTDIEGKPNTLGEDRQKIRDYLAKLTNIDKAIEGVTGLNYFDEQGNIQKPISIGIYKNQSIISALIQLQDIRYLNKISNLDTALDQERVLLIDNKYMYQTNVVYTGIKINEISELDLTNLTYTLDFKLWFRFQGDINPQQIKFLNATELIELGPPLINEVTNQMTYHLYRVKGRFKADFLPNHHAFKQHVLGISFRHTQLTRNNLIYVTDILGMRLTENHSLPEQMQQAQILSTVSGWIIQQVWFFQNTATENSLGNPQYLGIQGGLIDYSQFNLGILIKPDEFSLSAMIPKPVIDILIIISLGSLIFLLLIKNRYLWKYSKAIFVLQVIMTFVLLFSSEIILLEWLLAQQTHLSSLELIITVFEILWWLIPAILLNVAAENFIWTPLEIRTERKVPNIVRALFSLMIYLLACFGIVAFVFGQQITSLLATSGVIAMIIGLAIKVNISNIFSGIAINLERPFRVGDWIKIGEFDEGKVVNITWRTTQVQTRNNCMLNVPNSTTSESTIHNFSYPNKIIEEWLFVYVDSSHTPAFVETILLQAAMSTEGVLDDPKPFTRLRDINEWAAEYTVGYYIDNYAKKNLISRNVWKSIWVHLEHVGIEPAIQQHEIYMIRSSQK